MSCYLEICLWQFTLKFLSFCNLHIIADFFFKFCQWRHFFGKKVYDKISWLLQICLTNDVRNNYIYNFGCNRYETTSFPNYATLTTKQGERIFLFLFSLSKRELNLKAVVKLWQNKKGLNICLSGSPKSCLFTAEKKTSFWQAR